MNSRPVGPAAGQWLHLHMSPRYLCLKSSKLNSPSPLLTHPQPASPPDFPLRPFPCPSLPAGHPWAPRPSPPTAMCGWAPTLRLSHFFSPWSPPLFGTLWLILTSIEFPHLVCPLHSPPRHRQPEPSTTTNVISSHPGIKASGRREKVHTRHQRCAWALPFSPSCPLEFPPPHPGLHTAPLLLRPGVTADPCPPMCLMVLQFYPSVCPKPSG